MVPAAQQINLEFVLIPNIPMTKKWPLMRLAR